MEVTAVRSLLFASTGEVLRAFLDWEARGMAFCVICVENLIEGN